jgi:hypothetical protein
LEEDCPLVLQRYFYLENDTKDDLLDIHLLFFAYDAANIFVDCIRMTKKTAFVLWKHIKLCAH